MTAERDRIEARRHVKTVYTLLKIFEDYLTELKTT